MEGEEGEDAPMCVICAQTTSARISSWPAGESARAVCRFSSENRRPIISDLHISAPSIGAPPDCALVAYRRALELVSRPRPPHVRMYVFVLANREILKRG